MTKKRKYKTWEEFKKELDFTKEDWREIEEESARIIAIARMRFREIRNKLRLTQEELARRAKLPRSTVSRFESGYSNPTLKKLSALAQAMNMRLEINLVPAEVS